MCIIVIPGGYFERAVSRHRTAYATVVQNRLWSGPGSGSGSGSGLDSILTTLVARYYVPPPRPRLPHIARGVVWFGQHAPHTSTFVPMYRAAENIVPR